MIGDREIACLRDAGICTLRDAATRWDDLPQIAGVGRKTQRALATRLVRIMLQLDADAARGGGTTDWLSQPI